MFDTREDNVRIGWKQSYELLRKKAMEQEPSFSGLALSLSIAFFVTLLSANLLNVAYQSFTTQQNTDQQIIEGGRRIEAGALVRLFIPSVNAAAPDMRAQAVRDTEYPSASAGTVTTQKVTIKNIGKDSWKPSEVTFETGASLKRISRLYKNSWIKFYEPVKLPREVKSGQSVDISFPIQIPNDLEGTIQENFQLVYANRPINGSLVRIFLTITKANAVAVAPSSPAPPVVSSPSIVTPTPSSSISQNSAPQQVVSNEPIIRVGLFSFTTAQRLSFNTIYDIYGGSQLLFSGVAAGTSVTVSFDPASRAYAVALSGSPKTTASPLRFIPRDPMGVATLLDYRNGPAWNPLASDNRFRGTIEVRYTEPAKKIWFINELPVEMYLKGMAETTNSSPLEFQKIMTTAARSYVMYHYQRGLQFGLIDASTKHADDHFHVDSYYDQVYRGYNSELRMPKLVAAIEATRGVVVTYAGKTVVTPYFSNSDGRTRDWTEVWGGSAVPWLKSVSVPYDVGKTLFGHGVGMSARGALLMVSEGKFWEDVLKYFYTGITLVKAY